MRIIPTIVFVLFELSAADGADDPDELGRVNRLRHVNGETRREPPRRSDSCAWTVTATNGIRQSVTAGSAGERHAIIHLRSWVIGLAV